MICCFGKSNADDKSHSNTDNIPWIAGTIVKIDHKAKEIEVLWDDGSSDKFKVGKEYTAITDKSSESKEVEQISQLLLLDNAPAGNVDLVGLSNSILKLYCGYK